MAGPQIAVLIARAEADFTSQVLGGNVKECDLIAKLLEGGKERGSLYDPATDLFLPDDDWGAGLTNLEYTPLCEIMGRSPIAARV